MPSASASRTPTSWQRKRFAIPSCIFHCCSLHCSLIIISFFSLAHVPILHFHPVLSIFRVGVVLFTAILAGCHSGQPVFEATDITGADFGKGFSLTDHTGKQRTLQDFHGKVVVVF